MAGVQRAFANTRLVCWTNPTSTVQTPVICDLRICVCDAVVAPLGLGRSLALPTRETLFSNTMISCFHGRATPIGFLKNPPFVPESRTVI